MKSHFCKFRCTFLLQGYKITLLFDFILHLARLNQQFIKKLTNYKFIMIKITNLTLTITHPNTLYITNKELKLVAGISMYATKTTGKILSEGNIKWDDIIVLPFYPLINFQIVTKHSFGYNPEQLQAVIQGNLILSEKTVSKDVRTITAPVSNLQGEKVGFLKVDIRQTNKRGPSIFNSSQALTQSPKRQLNQSVLSIDKPTQSQSSSQQYLKISSIIAHVQQLRGKNIYIVFKSGSNMIKTSDYTSKSGQIVYICDYQLKKDNLSIQLVAEIYENQLGNTHLHSKTAYIIDQFGKVAKKGELADPSNKIIGQMFLQCKIRAKNRKKQLNSLLQSHLQTSYINNDHSLNEALKSSVAKKKVSIINSNNEIRFSKQKRFFGMLEDKKSDYISYQSGGTFEFKQTSNDRYYKGASIGRGSKVDFTHAIKANPGVGQYRLPSIWDRY